MATGVGFYRQKADVCPCIEGHSNTHLLLTLVLCCSAWLTDHCKTREDISHASLCSGPEIVHLEGDGALKQVCLAPVLTLPVADSLNPQVFFRTCTWKNAALQGCGLLVHTFFHTYPGYWSKTSVYLLSFPVGVQGTVWEKCMSQHNWSLLDFSIRVVICC